MLANNSAQDVVGLDFEHTDQLPKLAARYNKLKGILMVCHNIISTYQPHPPAAQQHNQKG